jgi:hypothetical protein
MEPQIGIGDAVAVVARAGGGGFRIKKRVLVEEARGV